MNEKKRAHPVVANPGDKGISLPATEAGYPPEPTGLGVFVTTGEGEEAQLSVVGRKRILTGLGRELWYFSLRDDAVARAPLQVAKRLTRDFVRSRTEHRVSTP